MAAQRRILLLSPASKIAPALREFAAERALELVRADDTTSAYERLRSDRFACALIDLDAVGEGVGEFVARARGLRPGLCAVGFGRVPNNGAAPAARALDLPLLAKPLTRDVLARALDESLRESNPMPPLEAARLLLEAPQEELRRRVGQLTTLYQMGRAISESRNWSEALDYFLATLRDYLEVRGAAILLYSREASVLAPRTVLSMPDTDVERCVTLLLEAYPIRNPVPEIHTLECYRRGAGLRCAGHTSYWNLTVLPLLYRRNPLGFLVLDKPYDGGAEFASELFFLQTIQTILAEEVANAVHLSNLVDLKNFNEAVLDNVESGVITVTETGTMPFANRLARQILGLSSESRSDSLQFDNVFEIDGAAAGARLNALPPGGSVQGEAKREDGRRVPVRLRARRIVNPGDSEPLFVVAFEDLTEQRLLEEQVRRADRLRSLGELSAAIAHEVRNPLQGISLTLANLQEHLKPGAETYVSVIFSEMQRLDSIVGGILSFARPAPPQPADVELGVICSRAVDLASDRAAKRDVHCELALVPADDRCEVDEGQILQVVLNILLNAVDASPPGGRVGVRIDSAPAPLLAATPGGPVWRIAVHDEGPGLTPEVRVKLFDPFFTTKSDGTGLGLAVCQKIVEEHRGSIHVESAPGYGTTFTVELPRRFEGAFAWPGR